MIRMVVVNQKTHHFWIESDEPIMVESSLVNGKPIITVFRLGNSEDIVGCYDGTITDNTSWKTSREVSK